MTPTLRRYILRNLAPDGLRLEFVDRLENLCSLSGTPMSPDLRQWVMQTFGLEMARVIEDYSSQTPPVFSPEMLDTIDRVIPYNYQGDDVNLMFRQQFDAVCVAPKCLFYTTYSNYLGGFSGLFLDIDGLYFPSAGAYWEIGTGIQTAYQLDAGGWALGGLGNNIWNWSLENNPIQSSWQSLNYDTFNWDPLTFNLVTCDLTQSCYEVDVPYPSGLGSINNFILQGASPFNNMDVGPSGGLLITDANFLNLMQSVFGGQAIITITDTGTSYYIKIERCYIAIAPKSITVDFITYGFIEVDC